MSLHRLAGIVFAALTLVTTHAAYGDWATEGPCCEPPVCGYGFSPQYYGGCDACDSCFDRLLFRVDYLCWKATEDGLELGTEDEIENFSNGAQSTCSHTVGLDFDYKSGFRLGAAYLLPCDGWDVTVNWIHYQSDASAHGGSLIGGSLTGANTYFFNDWERNINFIPDVARARWNLDLDVVDLELARRFYFSECVSARPFIGLRFANIDQSYKVHSSADRTPGFVLPIQFESSVHATSDFMGLGVRAGFDIEYKFGCGVGVFAEAAAALVYGETDRHTREAATQFSGSSQFDNDYGTSTKTRRSRAMTDLALGLKWDDCFCWCNRYHPFGVAIAWEHHAFYNLNQFRSRKILFSGNVNTNAPVSSFATCKVGDLMTQGLTLSFYLGF